MARWTDIADWVGPTNNQGGLMRSHRGVVVHIAEGYYQGTISWQRNPDSEVSSHFIVGRQRGEIAQMVDTSRQAWAQRSGNRDWLSIEFEGFTAGHRLHKPGWEKLTAWQIEAGGRILARAHQVYGVPLQVTDTPRCRGLGHHSMGAEHGYKWGHPQCPGEPIKGQKPAIVSAAVEIVGGDVSAENVIDGLRTGQPFASEGVREWAQAAGWGNVSQRALLEYVWEQSTRANEKVDQVLAEMAALREHLGIPAATPDTGGTPPASDQPPT